MIKLISEKRAHRLLEHHDDWIQTVSSRYGVPVAFIKAILFQEMTRIDLADPLVDVVVASGLTSKKDSSTGYAQIFGYVGLNAINYAVDKKLATYESLGISTDHRLSSNNPKDVKLVWRKLHRNMNANIEIATLNMLVAAEEMVGSTDFANFTDDELKLVFTRYNANAKRITQYGEDAFLLYTRFLGEGGAPANLAQC